jgi:DnaJ-class molecular chaperone
MTKKFVPEITKTIDFSEIEKAREILELPEKATLAEIKEAYRRLSLRCHPDRVPESKKAAAAKKFRRLTGARDVLLRYLASYRFDFSKEEFKKHLGPESKDLFTHFYEKFV